MGDVLEWSPESDLDVVDQLDAAGFLAPKPAFADVPIGEAVHRLEVEVAALLAALSAPLGLADAVSADRDGR